ncbi:MAG TPA: amidohydrolase family protein [Thermoanaerobaculia bacterium]
MLENLRIWIPAAFFALAVPAADAPGQPAADEAAPPGAIAFIDVNVVPMDAEHVREGQTVVVDGGKIVAVGPAAEVSVPQDARKIEGRGRFLMPGLADMHVHLLGEDVLLLFVANGVTTVRNMFGSPLHLQMREKIARGELLGPRIYTAGPIIDGSPPEWDGSAVVETADQAETEVARQKAAGYDFLKVYDRLPLAAYDALVQAAREHRIPVAGHVPRAVGLEHVLASGQQSIEHLEGYSEALLGGGDSEWNRKRAVDFGREVLAGRRTLSELFDGEKLSSLAAATRDAGVWNVPTLVVWQRVLASATEAETLLARPEMAYVSPVIVATWKPSTDFRRSALADEDMKALQVFNQLRLEEIRALRRAGARLLLGTDTPNPYVVPGFSIHQELRNLVAAGLSPYQAIRAGTRDAAEFLGAHGEFGTVEPGRRADLILVEGDPLADVGNVARSLGIMVRGRWLDKAELEQRLERLAASHTAGDWFAVLPPLPEVGESANEIRFEKRFNGTQFGAERLLVARRPDGYETLVAQAVTDIGGRRTELLRWELDAAGATRQLIYEGTGGLGSARLEILPEGSHLAVTGRLASNEAITSVPPLAPEVHIDIGMAASYQALLGRLDSLADGESLTVSTRKIDISEGFGQHDETLTVRRVPDGRRRGASATIVARLYEVEARSAKATVRYTLAADAAGFLVSAELEHQMGILSLQRAE